MFNTETELSDYVLDARFGLPVEVDVGALQPFEHHHMTLSQLITLHGLRFGVSLDTFLTASTFQADSCNCSP